jgi:hypothetical protein
MRRHLWWDRSLGMWALVCFKHFKVDGTIPHNAEIWTFNVEVGKYLFSVGSGPHRYIEFSVHGKQRWHKTRNAPDCNCYLCVYYFEPTVEEWKVMSKLLREQDLPTHMCAWCNEPWYYDQPVCTNAECGSHTHFCDNCEGVDPATCMFLKEGQND